MKLSIQTVFLPRESLPYMEEWLVYHTLLGFDKFRIYDNTGSSGAIRSSFRAKYGSSLTKYGLPVIPFDITNEDINQVVKKICSKFNVELISWPSPHFDQKILLDSIKDHCVVDDSDYTAFIDMDEYICIGENKNIKKFIEEDVVRKGFCGVRMSQQKMPHILKEKITSGRMVWELTDTFQMETRGWAPKNILPTKEVIMGQDIHNLSCSRLFDQPDRNLIKFNHYNVNQYQMFWLKSNHMKFDRKTPFERLSLGQSKDHSLDRFAKEMSNWNYVNLDD